MPNAKYDQSDTATEQCPPHASGEGERLLSYLVPRIGLEVLDLDAIQAPHVDGASPQASRNPTPTPLERLSYRAPCPLLPKSPERGSLPSPPGPPRPVTGTTTRGSLRDMTCAAWMDHQPPRQGPERPGTWRRETCSPTKLTTDEMTNQNPVLSVLMLEASCLCSPSRPS
jgi:hypothetical protein